MLGIIYKATSKTSRLSYIGKSINFKKRKRDHKSKLFSSKSKEYNTHFGNAVRLYGWDDFEWVILYDSIPINQLNNMERFVISNYNTYSRDGKCGYNSTPGGDGVSEISDLTRQKLSKVHKGKMFTEERKQNISRSKMGLKASDEARKNLSIARRKRITTEKTKKTMSLAAKGKINIKKYKLISPEGKEFITNNGLVLFCEEHKLDRSSLYRLMKNQSKYYKGWSIEKL